jgi:hypothetical protein
MLSLQNKNIWDFYPEDTIVITTNMMLNKNGHCVMGKGLALEMKTRYPEFPGLLAPYRFDVQYWFRFNVITFPTKVDWKEKSDTHLIIKGLRELLRLKPKWNLGKIYLPPLGCGNGGLNYQKDVLPILERLLIDDTFIIVTK